ncbi:hypothetical protein EYC84_004874 [Monilinia fructicola]|uniref:Uncharacterized protein n=1 Tax=Monilinia fructicola TaxID=38448 RepID=A0A5M9K1U3_MONFR|nr:hypothetical protein EYC84_004874 [Monilinia fructicola]
MSSWLVKMPRAGGGHDEAQIIWLLEAGLSDCLIVPAQLHVCIQVHKHLHHLDHTTSLRLFSTSVIALCLFLAYSHEYSHTFSSVYSHRYDI